MKLIPTWNFEWLRATLMDTINQYLQKLPPSTAISVLNLQSFRHQGVTHHQQATLVDHMVIPHLLKGSPKGSPVPPMATRMVPPGHQLPTLHLFGASGLGQDLHGRFEDQRAAHIVLLLVEGRLRREGGRGLLVGGRDPGCLVGLG